MGCLGSKFDNPGKSTAITDQYSNNISSFQTNSSKDSDIFVSADESIATRSSSGGAPAPDPANLVPSSLRQFPFAALEAATSKFHRRNCIGEGGFGIVYRGVLQPGANGLGPTPSEVAIKRMRESNERYTEEFLKEVIVLGRLSHPHLVRLHGYCMERDEALLVYEFMTGGCLHRALVDSANGELFFSWDMRLKVAVQIAEALAYMHGLNFIHRDLKAANVLLSPEYDAKLTDFGMVRVGPEGQLESIVSTRIMGTEGYIDPTYMETGHLGAKSDVYSFGVLLLELVTGRSVVDEGSKMVTECRTRFSDLKLKAAAYVDPKLGNQYPELGARTLATLARHCVAESRSSRPEISSVLEKLKMLVRACAHAEAKAAAKAAALAAGESGSGEEAGSEAEGAETEVAEANGVEEGPPPQSATAPV
ncbi:hypothetical protein CLOM_g9157 [Closterium sp. NIES-68]|nr:hypothetical protein CLOM_g3138 [Closterium sp. NIES-68]GJP50000.1 hypothetical protein CLOM_g9157 [Closterium sp. NIES-68]GJP62145.1 hypothetical protein CLOP_g19238 [Closterium sp. NIES-67]